MLSDVPQDSVLGPFLFLTFVNDLPDWVKSRMQMFADNTKIWAKIKVKVDTKKRSADARKMVR